MEKELYLLRTDLGELSKRDFRPGRLGYSSIQWGQVPSKGFESGLPYSAETLELMNMRGKKGLVTPVMPHVLCLSRNGLIGNEIFQGKLFLPGLVWQVHLKCSSDLRNSPRSSQIFWCNSPTEIQFIHRQLR